MELSFLSCSSLACNRASILARTMWTVYSTCWWSRWLTLRCLFLDFDLVTTFIRFLKTFSPKTRQYQVFDDQIDNKIEERAQSTSVHLAAIPLTFNLLTCSQCSPKINLYCALLLEHSILFENSLNSFITSWSICVFIIACWLFQS